MITSELGLNKLKQREGIRLRAYLDTKGVPTIGVGHTGPEVCLGLIWTTQKAMEVLEKDVKWAEDAVNENVKVALQQHQFDALVSFVFNIGVAAFKRSTCLKLLNEKAYDLAASAMLMWNKPPEIIGRRESEVEQFNGRVS